MSLTLYLLSGLVGLLLLLVTLALRGLGRPVKREGRPEFPEESGICHISHLPQIRRALALDDYEFLAGKSLRGLERRVRRERRRVALCCLAGLQEDFKNLLRIARIIARLSPEIEVVQEVERLRLTVTFLWRYEMIRIKLLAGFAPLPQMESLGNLVSGLSVRLEEAVKKLGERAAIAAELASALERSGLDAF